MPSEKILNAKKEQVKVQKVETKKVSSQKEQDEWESF